MAAKPLKIGMIMDPIATITPKKDSSLAMLLEAQRRDAEIYYFEQHDLRMLSGEAAGRATRLRVRDDNDDWFEFGARENIALGELDAILMRKDPPFDMEYIYTTYILDRAEQAGALIVNRPQALRDMNEKAYTAWFPEHTPLTLVTRSMSDMKKFLAERSGCRETTRWHGWAFYLCCGAGRQKRQRHFRNADRPRAEICDGPGVHPRDQSRRQTHSVD